MYVTPRPRRAGTSLAALAALTVAGSALTGGHAFAANNGDIKIHAVGTPATGQENDPHVCAFYLDAFNFDPGDVAAWSIVTQPPSSGPAGDSGELTIGADGTAQSAVIDDLPDGHYKLTFLTADGDGGPGKQKVFWVECATTPPTTPPPTTNPPTTNPPTTYPPTTYPPHGGPHGGPPAGGGGLARDAAVGPVAGATAVALAAVGGAVWFRLRRRPHGAS